MIHLDVHLFFLYILNLGAVYEILDLAFCPGRVLWSPGAASGEGRRELQLVGDLGRMATALEGEWLHFQDQEMARCSSARKSYTRMKVLQQLC